MEEEKAQRELPKTYETGVQAMTKKAEELLKEYKEEKKKGSYELTTEESQEIREAIKTAGSVRKELMQTESVGSYQQLSPKAKEKLQQAYSEASKKIAEIVSKKVNAIVQAYQNEEMSWESAEEAEKRLGEKVAGIIEVAKKDFGVPSNEIEKYEQGGERYISTIKPPLIWTRDVEMEDRERWLKEEFNRSYQSKWSKIESELEKKK